MFRNRLTLALGALAIVSLLQGAVAWWAIDVSARHVERGRVASDILSGFLELSAAKQRLRIWLSQTLMSAGADPQHRVQLRSEMDAMLNRLDSLEALATRLDRSLAENSAEHQLRQDALNVLEHSVQELDRAMSGAQPLSTNMPPVTAWAEIARIFDISQGRDLRTLLAESISRETTAMVRERAAADRSLAFARLVSLGTTAFLAFSAAAMGLYFARALRKPFDELSAGARALQDGNLMHRIPDHSKDEFAYFARSVNAMASELHQHREREAQQRLQLEELVDFRTTELRQALHTLQQLDARRRQLFNDVGHELRTPATAIRGEAEVALRGRDKPVDEYKASLRSIVGAVQQLGTVIDDLLTMARSDIDVLTMQREQLDIADPLFEAVQQARALGRERGVQVADPSGSGRGTWVLGDANRLRQLFTLLLDNAVRYSHVNGAVLVTCTQAMVASGQWEWCVEIVDEGIGITKEELPRLFTRNYRSERAKHHCPEGSGLGLAIAASLARVHGGHIQINSEHGQGTVVRLSLPVLAVSPALPVLPISPVLQAS